MPAPIDLVPSPGLLWCEGPDDFAFLLAFLGHLRISQATIHVERLDGRPQLHDYLNGLPLRDQSKQLKALYRSRVALPYNLNNTTT